MSGGSRCESFAMVSLFGDASTHMCICMQVYMRMSLCVDILRSKYIYANPPPGPTFQCSKIPKLQKNPVNFLEIPKFQKGTDYWNSKKLTGFFWNFGISEFLNFGISK